MPLPWEEPDDDAYDYAKIKVCIPAHGTSGPTLALSMVVDTGEGMEAILYKNLPSPCSVYFQRVDCDHYRITLIERLF